MSDQTTVLVVDDDAYTRRLVKSRLEGAGYAVLEAPDAASALSVFRQSGPHLVIADLVLPGRTGLDLISDVRTANPLTPVIAISGAPEELAHLLEEAREQGAMLAMPKPFTTSQLLEAVESALAVTPPPAPTRRSNIRKAFERLYDRMRSRGEPTTPA